MITFLVVLGVWWWLCRQDKAEEEKRRQTWEEMNDSAGDLMWASHKAKRGEKS